MQKLLLTCECGERVQVPRSALGRVGLCPACGQHVAIRADNTTPLKNVSRRVFSDARVMRPSAFSSTSEDEDKRTCGKAVDLYFEQKPAEALAIFETLLERHPNNPDLEACRRLCVEALRERLTSRATAIRERLDGRTLDESTVKEFLLHMMLNGSTEEIQLRAAEIAGQLLLPTREQEVPALEEPSTNRIELLTARHDA